MYSEEKRGNWFNGNSTNMLYTDLSYEEIKSGKESDFYIINEQGGHLIKLQDRKHIELMKYCMYGSKITRQQADWLIHDAKLRFFESVDSYIEFLKSE